MRPTSRSLPTVAFGFMAVCLGTACLDWDSLRGGVDANVRDASPDVTPGQTESPVVECVFADLAAGEIVDRAKLVQTFL